jgi:ribose transport system substrate-binding protein
VSNWKFVTRRAAVVTMACTALAVSACGEDKVANSGNTGSAEPAATSNAAASGDTASLIDSIKKGTSVDPPAESRPIAKGKSVVFAVNGMNQQSSAINVKAGLEACKAVGWNCSVVDGKSDPTQWPGLIRTAITQKPDAIVVQGIDCSIISTPLKEAAKAGIKTVGMDSFDCNDPAVGGKQEFSSVLLYPNPTKPTEAMDYGKYAVLFGQAKAAATVAGAGGKANVIMICDDEALVLKYICDGQTKEFKTEGATVTRVDTRLADLGPKLESQTSSALLKNPSANAIVSPHGGATLNIAPAVQKAGKTKKVFVMGSEGLTAELDMIRAGLVGAVIAAPVPWKGWAAVDTVNQVLAGKPALNNGLGWLLADKSNVPAAKGTDFPASTWPDYIAAYKKAWGVS